MTIKEITTLISKKEGLKTEVSIGNIREIIGIVCDLIVKDSETMASLIANGVKRAKRKKK